MSDKYEPIDRSAVPEIYRLMDDLIRDFHSSDLCEARVGLAWVHDVKPDRDGHLVWGRAKKIGELERNYIPFDFLILLNRHVWGELGDKSKRALLDHELSHCGLVTNDDGDKSYYVRKHDLEEFNHIVRRYGLWRENVEKFVNDALQKKDPSLFDGQALPPPGEGDPVQDAIQDLQDTLKTGDSLTIEAAGRSVTLTGKSRKK